MATGPALSPRTPELDGLRGCAALSVVIFHMTWELFGTRMPWLKNPVTAFALDGKLAVAIFFVLSGEALASGVIAGGGLAAIGNLALKRIPRLSIPIFAATLLTVLCQRNGWVFQQEALPLLGVVNWSGKWLVHEPSLSEVVRFAFWGVYFDKATTTWLMPFLWTMRAELLGSAFVFLLLAVFHRARRFDTVLLTAFMAILVLDASLYLSCFICGVYFARLRAGGFFAEKSAGTPIAVTSTVAILALAAIDSRLHLDGGLRHGPLVAPVLLFCIFLNRPLTRALRSPLCVELGRLSFPLYLVQFPVLVSLSCGLVVAGHDAGRLTDVTCLAIAGVSIAASLLVAKAFMPVEDLTTRVGRILVAALRSRRTRPPHPVVVAS